MGKEAVIPTKQMTMMIQQDEAEVHDFEHDFDDLNSNSDGDEFGFDDDIGDSTNGRDSDDC